MLERTLRLILTEYPEPDVERFMDEVWSQLIEERFVDKEYLVDNLLDMATYIPILKIDSNANQITLREYLTSDLPKDKFENNIDALHYIADGVTEKVELGKMLSSSDREETWFHRGNTFYHDLMLFSLIKEDGELTDYGQCYLKTKDQKYIRAGILTNPLMNMYVDLLEIAKDIFDEDEKMELLLRITKLIIRNSQGSNLIVDSVAEKYLKRATINWFVKSELVDENLCPLHPKKEESLLLKKLVDWSLFQNGLHVKQKYHQHFFEINQEKLPLGHSRSGKFIFEGTQFDISIKNSNRDVKGDTIHIRYDGNSELKEKITQRFRSTYGYYKENKIQKRQLVKIPEEQQEYLCIYSTSLPYQYRIDFITQDSKEDYKAEMSKINNIAKDEDEKIFEMSDRDFRHYFLQKYGKDEASHEIREGLTKHRKIRNTLVNDLKKKYKNACQICKFSFKDQYGQDYSEGHHIKPFAKSEDHSPDNILILCPNHHRIIHKAKPKFDRQKKAFIYKNGLIEELSLNIHL